MLSTGFREFQQDIHDCTSRFIVACIHRRAGKTLFSLDWLLDGAREAEPGTHVRNYYVAPFRNQAKAIAFDLACQLTENDADIHIHKSDLYFEFPQNGARVQLLGADGFDKHRGKYADRVAFDETGQIPPAAWREVFRPMLADRRGSALFIGTPRGRNFFKDLYDLASGGLQDWRAFLATAEDTGIIDADELASLRREMSRSEYAREFMCDWDVGAPGAYFGFEMEKASTDERLLAGELHNPEELVHASISLCAGDAICVTYWQHDGRNPYLIESHRYVQERVDQVAKEILAKPYVYDRFVYGINTGRRSVGVNEVPFRLQALRKLGLRGPVMKRRAEFVDDVQSTKMMLSRSRYSTEAGIDALDALRQCRAEYDDERQSFMPYPVDDWCLDLVTSVNAFAAFERRGLGRRSPIEYGRGRNRA